MSTGIKTVVRLELSQLASHQCYFALADCLRWRWHHHYMWAILVTGATLHEVLGMFSSDLRIPASRANSEINETHGLTCRNLTIEEKLAHKTHVTLFLCFCRKNCTHLGLIKMLTWTDNSLLRYGVIDRKFEEILSRNIHASLYNSIWWKGIHFYVRY